MGIKLYQLSTKLMLKLKLKLKLSLATMLFIFQTDYNLNLFSLFENILMMDLDNEGIYHYIAV